MFFFFFTIYMGKTVGSQFGQMVGKWQEKFRTDKLHSKIVNNTYINQFLLPKNAWGSLKLVSNMGFSKW